MKGVDINIKIDNVSKLYSLIRGHFEISVFEISRVDYFIYLVWLKFN